MITGNVHNRFSLKCPHCGARVDIDLGSDGGQVAKVICQYCGKTVQWIDQQLEFHPGRSAVRRYVAIIILAAILVSLLLGLISVLV